MQNASLFKTVWEFNRLRVIMTVVLLLLVLGMAGWLRWVSEPELLGLRTKQSQLQQEVRQRQLEYERSGLPVSAAEQLDRNIRQFRELIPQQRDFSVFLGELFTWAGQAGLEIGQISYQLKQEETGYLRYSLSFSVNGKYDQVKKFVHLLENTRRILVIEGISLSGANSREKGQRVSLNIEIATYFQRGEV